jgi:hypothetical protein
MNTEDRFWLSLTAIIAGGICTLVIGGMLVYNQRLKTMTQAGYEEGVLPGVRDARWVKSHPKP